MLEALSVDGIEETPREIEIRSSHWQPRGALEIHDGKTGRVWCQVLSLPRFVIGSTNSADIVLDDASVAPIHAELVSGPSGQWWIHDLESENGTYVRGRRSQEQLLAPGDEVGIGVFRLRLRTRSSPELRLALASDGNGPPTVRMGSPLPANGVVATVAPGATAMSTLLAGVGNQIGAAHLRTMMALGRQLMEIEEVAARRALLCQFVVGDSFPGESAAVVRVTGPQTARAVEGPIRRSGNSLPLFVSDQIVRQLWETRQPVNSSTPPSAPRNPAGGFMHTVTLCPLRVEEDILDALYVELPCASGGPEWRSLVALAAEAFQQAELVWDMRSHVRESSSVERELEMAREIQQGLIPKQGRLDSVLQELEVVVGFEPCRWVGGDYVDAIPLLDGRVLLAIGDVCGKGLQAALVASSLHTLVHVAVDMGHPSLPDLLQRINRHMCRYLPDHVFVTMLCVAVDVRTGALEIVSAGHPPAMVAGPYGNIRSVDVGHNVALGLTDTAMVSGECSLGPDEVLLLYTDGLTEMVDEHRVPLGGDKLADCFSRIAVTHDKRGASAMREALMTALRSYRSSRLAADDTTFLMARRRGSSSLRP